jgi:hypothetical protein
VVHRHRLARTEHEEVDPELRELRLTLEVADGAAPLRVSPAGLAGVEDEPALSLGVESIFGRFEPCLRNHLARRNRPMRVRVRFRSVS